MKKSRAVSLFAGLVAFGMLAAACGSDDSGSSDTTAASTETTAAGGSTETTAAGGSTETTAAGGSTETTAAGGGGGGGGGCEDGAEPIKIGGLAQAQNFPGMEDGIQAVIDKANEDCIGGRPLEFVGLQDDGSDPAKNLSLAQSLVEQDGVFAIIATSAVLLPQTTDYLASKQVPFFGWGFMPGFCGDDSWGYGFNGCLSAFALGYTDQVNTSLIDPIATYLDKAPEDVTLVTFNADDDSGKFGKIQYDALFTKEQVLANANVPVQGAGDYTQYVNLVLDENPDAVMISTDFVSAIKLKGALQGSGYEGLVYDYVSYIPGLLESSPDTAAALEGGFSVSQFPANEDDTPAVQQIAADLAASGSELPFPTQGASIGYWSTDLLRQMLVATAAAGEITSENFRTVVEGGFTSETLEGGLGEVTYPDDHKSLAPCSGLVQVVDGKFVSAEPFACYELRSAQPAS